MFTSFRISTPCALGLLSLLAVALFAADPEWKVKPPSSWTEEDARQILSDSPWAKTVKAGRQEFAD